MTLSLRTAALDSKIRQLFLTMRLTVNPVDRTGPGTHKCRWLREAEGRRENEMTALGFCYEKQSPYRRIQSAGKLGITLKFYFNFFELGGCIYFQG